MHIEPIDLSTTAEIGPRSYFSWAGLNISRYHYGVCVSPLYKEMVHCLQLARSSRVFLDQTEGGVLLRIMWWTARFSETGWCTMPAEPIRLSDRENPLSFTADGHPQFTWQGRIWHLTPQIGDDMRQMLAHKCPGIRQLGVV